MVSRARSWSHSPDSQRCRWLCHKPGGSLIFYVLTLQASPPLADRTALHSGLGQATYTCVPLSPSSITWYGQGAVTLWGWKGDCSSGDALAMYHRLCGLSTYGLKAHVRKMITPPKLTIRHFPPLLVLTVLDLANTNTGINTNTNTNTG